MIALATTMRSRRMCRAFVQATRRAQLGDTVTANFHGRFVNEPDAEPINVEDVDVVLGGEGVVQEITDNLTATKADDEKTFSINYPEDFSAKGLAGKHINYTAKV